MTYFLCVSSCRSGVPSFFRRAREKIEVLEVIKIGKNWEKLGKTAENCGKLGKTGENWGNSVFTNFREFWWVLVSFGEFLSVLNSLEIRYNLFTINLKRMLSPRSTQRTPLHRSSISKFQPKIVSIFSRMNNAFPIFFIFCVEFCIFSAKFGWNFIRISRDKFQKRMTCVAFSIKFAKTN